MVGILGLREIAVQSGQVRILFDHYFLACHCPPLSAKAERGKEVAAGESKKRAYMSRECMNSKPRTPDPISQTPEHGPFKS